jgi:hypothetical protein
MSDGDPQQFSRGKPSERSSRPRLMPRCADDAGRSVQQLKGAFPARGDFSDELGGAF